MGLFSKVRAIKQNCVVKYFAMFQKIETFSIGNELLQAGYFWFAKVIAYI